MNDVYSNIKTGLISILVVSEIASLGIIYLIVIH